MKKSYYHRVKHHLRKPIHRAIKQKATPHSIAIGFAIGTFIAIFPTFFLGLLIILLIMIFYKTMNKIAAVAGLLFWNIIMMAPIYYLSYNIGRFVFRSGNQSTLRSEGHDFIAMLNVKPFSFENVMAFLRENLIFLKEYLVGNFILATAISIISYFIIKRAVILYRETKEKKRLFKINKEKENIIWFAADNNSDSADNTADWAEFDYKCYTLLSVWNTELASEDKNKPDSYLQYISSCVQELVLLCLY